MRRLGIFLLAAFWTGLVFVTYHDVGYDHAAGFPTFSECLLPAVIASLPLWLGLITANKRQGWPCYLRWFCAAVLLIGAFYIGSVTWMQFLVYPPLLAPVMLLWPELTGQPINPPEPNAEEKIRLRKIQQLKWSVLMVCTAVLFWWGWLHNPLPSDEEMIGNFNQHRKEFEQLVQGYRNFRPAKYPAPLNVSVFEKSSLEVEALLYKTGINDINHGGKAWMPDPYSERIARIRGEYYGHSEKRSPQERMAYWQRNVPELFANVAPFSVIWRDETDRLAGEIHLSVGEQGQLNHKFRLRYGLMSQAYFYFPQIPIVRNGWLLEPDYDLQNKPTTYPRWRVLDSLNNYPPNWKAGECVLKRIDDHWFLAMCRAA